MRGPAFALAAVPALYGLTAAQPAQAVPTAAVVVCGHPSAQPTLER